MSRPNRVLIDVSFEPSDFLDFLVSSRGFVILAS